MAKVKKAAQPMYWVFFGVGILIFSLLLINWTLSIPMWRSAGALSTEPTKSTCLADECTLVSGITYPAGKLDNDMVSLLNDVLLDEYKAYSLYSKAILKFGQNRPFTMIARSEEQHISSVKSLFDKYGLTIPANGEMEKVNTQSTFVATCKQSATLEREYITKMEKTFLPKVKNYPDISIVFSNILAASKTKHLPAFERCQ